MSTASLIKRARRSRCRRELETSPRSGGTARFARYPHLVEWTDRALSRSGGGVAGALLDPQMLGAVATRRKAEQRPAMEQADALTANLPGTRSARPCSGRVPSRRPGT